MEPLPPVSHLQSKRLILFLVENLLLIYTPFYFALKFTRKKTFVYTTPADIPPVNEARNPVTEDNTQTGWLKVVPANTHEIV